MKLKAFLTEEEGIQIGQLKQQMFDSVSWSEVLYYENQIHGILDQAEQRLNNNSVGVAIKG
ncbi:hypothetical protein [Ferdinandcohnia sp. SAFN-114]|uniref:hypothetical protein n=1 Tax=Ferdinandcohnia sp. SAFN-114 TaxID=3387275 RepID=UPI003F7D9E68